MTARRDYADYDRFNVDRLAVEFACNGTKITLNRDERVLAVLTMAGRVPNGEIVRRLNTHDNEVVRILHAVGAVKCPVCYQLARQDDQVLRPHVDTLGISLCPMSNQTYDDRAAITARRPLKDIA